MTCTEFKELAGSLALGALDPEERAEAEAHLKQPHHEGCWELVASMGEAGHLLALALPPVSPGLQVWERIALQTSGRPPARLRQAVGWGLAAALAAALAALLLHPPANEERERQVVAAERERCNAELASRAADRELERRLVEMLDSPTSHLLALAAQKGEAGRATALLDLAAHKAMVLSRTLPAQAGKDYQLWVIRGKSALPAGLVHQLEGGLAIGDFSPTQLDGQVDAVAISLEPAGGSLQPTHVLMVGPVKG
jgi:anti-sigma-K factor RskA